MQSVGIEQILCYFQRLPPSGKALARHTFDNKDISGASHKHCGGVIVIYPGICRGIKVECVNDVNSGVKFFDNRNSVIVAFINGIQTLHLPVKVIKPLTYRVQKTDEAFIVLDSTKEGYYLVETFDCGGRVLP